ncbi:MAG: hypothetical protein Q4G67_09965 [Actinomycetia bacterium]|nr:hypothetical protein [Actinomycetes bacterium]
MEQAVTLGAYAGTVALPLVRSHAESQTGRLIDGIVRELWAGLPLVHHSSYVDQDMPCGKAPGTRTALASADLDRPPEHPQDLVPDVLDMVRTAWQLMRSRSARELAAVTSFRFTELVAGMDHVYAHVHGRPHEERPGTLESVAQECIGLVKRQRAPGSVHALGDEDLFRHGIAVGEHLLECVEQGTECALMTMTDMERLGLQITTVLSAAGFPVLTEEDTEGPGICVEAVDDLDFSRRHVAVHWHSASTLRQRCTVAVDRGDYSADALKQGGLISTAMGRALKDIVTSAGFAIRSDDSSSSEHYVLVTGLRAPEDFAAFVESAAE